MLTHWEPSVHSAPVGRLWEFLLSFKTHFHGFSLALPMQSVVLVVLLGCAAAASPPTGRWEGDVVGGAPSGHLG